MPELDTRVYWPLPRGRCSEVARRPECRGVRWACLADDTIAGAACEQTADGTAPLLFRAYEVKREVCKELCNVKSAGARRPCTRLRETSPLPLHTCLARHTT